MVNAQSLQYDGSDFDCDEALSQATDPDVVHSDELVSAYHHTRPFWVNGKAPQRC